MLITNLNKIKAKDIKCGDTFIYKSLVFIIELNHSFASYKYNAFNKDTGKTITRDYGTGSLTDIKEMIVIDNSIAEKHNNSPIANLIKEANKKVGTDNKYHVSGGLWKGDTQLTTSLYKAIEILEQVINGETLVTSRELWLTQAPSFNFELDEVELLAKAVEKSFVSKVAGDLYKINKDY